MGAIVNQVYFHATPAANLTSPIAGAMLADAPVSYPFLWDTPQHDVVQWLGIARSGGPFDIQSLARNVGEVLGVFAEITIPEKPSLLNIGYSSSVKIPELGELENLLKTLWSPQWPADFPKIDQTAAAKGAALYQANCLSCHALINRKDPNRKITAVMKDVGTDQRASTNFFNRTGPSGKLSGVNINFVPFTPKIGPIADADTMVSNEVIGIIVGQFRGAPPDELQQINFRGAPAGTIPLAVARKRPATNRARSTESGRQLPTCTTAPYPTWMHYFSLPPSARSHSASASKPLIR